MGLFFNFSSRTMADWWARRSFLQGWWRQESRDRRWVPPAYRLLYQSVVNSRCPHLQRYNMTMIVVDAVQRSSFGGGSFEGALPAVAGEVRVGQGALLFDVQGQQAHLALLEVANDEECLERLMGAFAEQISERGGRRLVVGAGLVPAFPAGILLDHYHLDPPLHSAYNAPFLPDLLAEQAEPLYYRRMWGIDLSADVGVIDAADIDIKVHTRPPDELATVFLPLVIQIWSSSMAAEAGLPAPDAAAMEFLLALWQVAPMVLFVAHIEGNPVGYCLLQPDVGPAMRRVQGGRPLWGRAWLAVRPPHSAASGRLLLGGVAPQWTRQGVGRALWRAALHHARSSGWGTLTVGPVDESTPVEELLAAAGATVRQRYALYTYGD